jgi:hypothetical protein
MCPHRSTHSNASTYTGTPASPLNAHTHTYTTLHVFDVLCQPAASHCFSLLAICYITAPLFTATASATERCLALPPCRQAAGVLLPPPVPTHAGHVPHIACRPGPGQLCGAASSASGAGTHQGRLHQGGCGVQVRLSLTPSSRGHPWLSWLHELPHAPALPLCPTAAPLVPQPWDLLRTCPCHHTAL